MVLPDRDRVRFHKYLWAPPSYVEEGIEQRIRGGAGTANQLQINAEIQGHLHAPKKLENPVDTIHEMSFKGKDGDLKETVWKVKIKQADKYRVVQEENSDKTGWAVFGMCVEKVDGS
ncbi:MAG: hypothetical protein ACW99F_16045 [Candidatus Hodarchaeales archaeon]|jgi:hypothetical protein